MYVFTECVSILTVSPVTVWHMPPLMYMNPASACIHPAGYTVLLSTSTRSEENSRTRLLYMNMHPPYWLVRCLVIEIRREYSIL